MIGSNETEKLKDKKEMALLVFIKLKFPRETKRITYTATDDIFHTGLSAEFKINEEIEKSREMSIPNHERMYLSYNV